MYAAELRRSMLVGARQQLQRLSVSSRVPSLLRKNSRPFSAISAPLAEEMRQKWQQDPASVHASWDVHFRKSGGGVAADPTWQLNARVLDFVRLYQVKGHLLANLDPLNQNPPPTAEELGMDPLSVFGDIDLETGIDLSAVKFEEMDNLLNYADINQDGVTTLRELHESLHNIYCRSVGYEYMHVMDREKCNWIRHRIEAPQRPLTKEQRLQVLDRLAWATMFERFLAKKWNATKRFGLEGLTALVPGLKSAIDKATQLGVQDISFGMPHRGRLNVLTNVIRKPLALIFKEFAGKAVPVQGSDDEWVGSGDVKYHLGTSFEREYPDGRKVKLGLLANPSHLEAVNPVVVGRTKARMHLMDDKKGEKCMSVLIHGDAAFAGQGVVYETMQLAQLANYQTGGSLHVIANNQVGFTTDPTDSRSTPYCSALGLTFEAPIFHVNASDIEEVCRVFRLAVAYRQEFHSDVIVDLIGFRRNGHQELDNPEYTQPLMYKKIANQIPSLDLHIRKLLDEGAFTQEEIDAVLNNIEAHMNEAFAASEDFEVPNDNWLSSNWEGLTNPSHWSPIRATGLPLETLAKIGAKLTAFPEGFELHRQLKKIMGAKAKAIEAQNGIDWGTAEALAFGSLLQDGIHIRLSGQDVQRGTFSHRHALLHDQKEMGKFVPLNHLSEDQAELVVSNSPLSEFGVLGFELGYSQVTPQSLVLWEAQFGDFVNSAQTIIDQFISAGEDKWLRQSGLVMLLPHGYDGQGPEHSSARLERFLEMCNEDPDSVPEMADEARMQIQRSNWQVVNCSTPANYFHVLRRQVCRKFRKPLIVMSPKALLRLRDCASSFEDMAEGTKFQRLIPEQHSDTLVADDSIRKICFCSGKLYYELLASRKATEVDDVALVRIEQLAPFPFDKVAAQVARYPNAQVAWVQEEPKNMGAWTFVQDRILTSTGVLNKDPKQPEYIGRKTMSAPAEGAAAVHAATQSDIIARALN